MIEYEGNVCVNGHDLTLPKAVWTRRYRVTRKNARGKRRVYNANKRICVKCQVEANKRYIARREAGLTGSTGVFPSQALPRKTPPTPERLNFKEKEVTQAERMRRMAIAGERELDRARKEGWIK